MKQEIPKPEEGKSFEPFTTTDAKLEDIRQNDSVTVESDENIKDKTEFEAKTVYIEISNLPTPPTPSAPPATSDMNSIPTPPPVPAAPLKADNLPAPTDLPAPPAAPSAPK